MIEKTVVKVTVARVKCNRCKFERTLYFMSNYSYGERVVTTKDGKYCAYVNMLEDSTISEIEKFCDEIFIDKKISMSRNKISRIVAKIYGITCDNINGEKIDTSTNWKCSNCENGELEEDKDYGERLIDLEMKYVSHDNWNLLKEHEKRLMVESELIRQKFI